MAPVVENLKKLQGPSYSFRTRAFAAERTYYLGIEALQWQSGAAVSEIFYRDVHEVYTYRIIARGEAALKGRTMFSMRLHCRSGRRLTLSPLHAVGVWRWEDRSAAYSAFTGVLLDRLRANADLEIVTATHWTLRLRHALTRRAVPWLLDRVGERLLHLIRPFGLQRMSGLGSRLMRLIGPWLPADRVGRANLKAAFPDKSDRDIDHILQNVWGNLGRTMAEYAFIDQFHDYDPLDPAEQRIVMDEASIRRVFALRDRGEPVLFFSAHFGSWEMAPLAAAFGLRLTILYRPFNSAAVNRLIEKVRGRIDLIPARFGALVQLEQALRQGSSLGMLVDQHFTGGADVVFFGRHCKVSPTLAQLARKYECPIYGARVIRLPNSRFHAELTEPLTPPRDGDGKINVDATMQMITGIVEEWVRGDPDQWLWLHRRWR